MIKHLFGLLFTCLLFTGSPAHAQLPQRVSNLHATGFTTAPRYLTSFNNKLYFSAGTARELWSYDGSASQPVLAAAGYSMDDFGAPNVQSSFPVLNGKMYLLGNTPSTPAIRLLSYDGTNPPDRAPGISDSVLFDQKDFITFGNRIFFGAGTLAAGPELYAYDGLSAPTIYDINPHSGSSPHAFTPFNGKLYFLATGDNATQGEELHVYDPATDQCSLVADIYPGPLGSECRGFTVAGNKMYFTASQPYLGSELWQTDGSSLTRLTDLATGGKNGVGSTYAYYQGNIIFSGSTDGNDFFPYKYNVSTGQIDLLSNDPSIKAFGSGAQEYKGKLYLTCTEGTATAGAGSELWKYDGTNLSMLPEIWPGQNSSNPYNYVVHNDYLYFIARDSANGIDLYRLFDPTSVINTRFDGELKLFPNPAATQATLELTLKSRQKLSVSLADMTGKEVFKTGIKSFETGKSELTIPLQSLACGSYSYQLISGNGSKMASGILVKE